MSVKYLPDPAAIVAKFDEGRDPYPVRLVVRMSDGRTVKYVRDIEQPHPSFLKVMDGLTRGYPKFGKHEKRSDINV